MKHRGLQKKRALKARVMEGAVGIQALVSTAGLLAVLLVNPRHRGEARSLTLRTVMELGGKFCRQ